MAQLAQKLARMEAHIGADAMVTVARFIRKIIMNAVLLDHPLRIAFQLPRMQNMYRFHKHNVIEFRI
jgi:hypothetical protein